MTFYLFFIFFIFYVNHSIKSVSTLLMESIVGGDVVYPGTFKYHASIFARNYEGELFLACGAAIVADKFVISSADCVMNENATLKNFLFVVYAGIIDFNDSNPIIRDVEKIYLPNFDSNFIQYNIAIHKLKEDLGIDQTNRLTKLELPLATDQYNELNNLAMVSGFGYDWIKLGKDPITGINSVIDGGAIDLLKSAAVSITSAKECFKWFPQMSVHTNICGIMLPDFPGNPWGLCFGDSGDPLVIGGVLVGIASKTSIDCDNTQIGALYSKVANFTDFIHNVIFGQPPQRALIFSNWRVRPE